MAKASGKYNPSRFRRGGCAAVGGRPVIFDPNSEYAIQSRLDAMVQKAQRAIENLASATTPQKRSVRKLPGKSWVPGAYAQRPGELLAMGITDASRALAEQSKTAGDCAKELNARYVEKLLRELGTFPKARRK